MAFEFDVVISGISGRFPECDDIDTFKTKLYSGDSNEFITSNDKKWTRGFKLNRYGDKVTVPDATGKYLKETEFDFRLFKFSQAFARSTDVINRKVLEPSFEAIVDAGINPYSLDGANIGVFTSSGLSERDGGIIVNLKKFLYVLGTAKTMGPNRLSYTLNLKGPSYAFHTDPLGGYDAFRVANEQISAGRIEAAVVAVTSNIVDPIISYSYAHLNLLSPDGFCRSFDKNANGYARSESTIVFFLQREQDAKRQYAKLLLCDKIFEGLSSRTLLAYDEEYLKSSLSRIYERNDKVPLEDIKFVELTGCAVKKFESAEVNAVADILCKNRNTPLMIGSVMSTVGHNEAAAGFLSILKTLLVLDSEIIPPNSNFSEINDDIRALRDKHMQVVDKKTELCGNIAAVNTIGMYGAVNHIVLQNTARKQKKDTDNIPRLLLLSGRTADGLEQVFQKIESDSFNSEAIALANDVFHTNMPLHMFRGFTVLPKTETTTTVIEESGHPQRPICFIFSGMGSQWNGMGKHLLDFPIIAEVIKRCDAVLKPKSIDIYRILLSEDPAIFDNITNSFVAIICLQIALVEVLKKLNIVPDIILGHSVGENGCAYVDGCLTLEQAVLVSYNRGIASTSTKTIKGMMAAVGKGYEEIKSDIPQNIEIACHNAVNSCTLSGPAEDVDAYVEKLKCEGVFAKSVNVANIAYHSKYIAPAAPKLLELLEEVIPEPKKRSSKWISSSVPESEWNLPIADRCSAEYLTNNLLKPVLFEEACKHIPEDAVCIEIAPHGLLQAILRRSLPETCTNISLTLKSVKKDNLNFFLSSIGKLYIAGCEPAVNNLYPSIEYPVSRGTPSISPYCTWLHNEYEYEEVGLPRTTSKPTPLSQENIIVRINDDAEFNFLRYHQINESTVIPPSFFLYLVWRILAIQQKVKIDEFPVLFEKIRVHKNVTTSISKPQLINIMIHASGSFEVLSRSTLNKKKSKVILTGRVEVLRDDDKEVPSTHINLIESDFLLNGDEINIILEKAGFLLGECFQLLTAIKLNDVEYKGKIEWKGNWVTFLDSIMKFQMFSDLKKSKLCFLKSIQKIIITPSVVNSEESGSSVVATYCKATKYFQCSGVEIYDLVWKTDNRLTTSRLPSSSKIREMRFVSYSNPSCQNHEEFVDLCAQISLESLEIANKIDAKFHLWDTTGKFLKSIRGSKTIHESYKEEVIFWDTTPFSNSLSQYDILLMITKEEIPDINVSHLEDVYILLILSKNHSNIISTEYSTILKQNFDDEKFILMKKKLNHAPIIRVEDSNKLHNGLSNGINHMDNGIVIRPNMDSTSLTLMFSKTRHHNTRYIFMDNNSEPWTEDEPRFLSILSTGLPKIVMKNQDWGSYRYRSSHLVSNGYDHTKLNNSLTDIQIKSIDVKCIRCEASEAHSSDKSSESQIQLLGVEYSGWNGTEKKIMGLTSTSLSENISKIDPLLTWLVPDEWTFTEAVTVPAVYAHVYSAMEIIEHSSYRPNQSILIITDGENIFAEALISLIMVKKLTIYVVVPNEQNAMNLKLKFPSLSDSSLIINTNNDFDIIILTKTKGKGVNILINFSTDFRNLTSLMNCNSQNSHIIETVDSYANEYNELGLYPFLKNCSFHSLPCKITHFSNLQNDRKSRLQKAIKEGIASGFVKPLPQRPGMLSVEKFKDCGIDESFDKCNSISQIQLNTDFKFSCDSMKFMTNRSYVIIVGERGADACMKIIQWLSERGALSIVVVVEKFFSTSRISSQINRLLGNKKITLSFRSLNKLNSTDDAVQLIDEINQQAPLDSVFFVSMESASRMINYMDNATKICKENIKFISFFAGGIEEMEARQRRGQPSFVLHGDRFPKNISELLIDFEKILKIQKSFDNQHILYEIIENSNSSDGSNELSSLRSFLPKSIHNLEEIGRNMASEEVKFVEMTSRCAKWAECRGVYPIFVIPGLHAFELQPLFQSLMYPVFCASLTEKSSSVHEVASKLYQHLNLIQKAGPVTLIGETWNAAVAIELSSLIKKSGRDFKLFVLEGNPIEWRNTINALNVTESQGFEKALTKIYGDKILEHIQLWNSAETKNFNHHLINEIPNGNHINFAHVCRCLRVLKQQFINVHKHDLTNTMLENTIFFSRKFTKDISLALSTSSDIIRIRENNYDSFIRSPVIRKNINKRAMFAW